MNTADLTDAKLHDLRETDFDELAKLAAIIWRAHYGPMIGAAQIDYMLGNRFSAENLRRYMYAKDRWLKVLRTKDAAIGYCSYALTDVTTELKLEQLYLLSAFRGRGLGGMMLSHVEHCARVLGCDTVLLQVSKKNADSIAVYVKSGYTVREEKVFDIGQGYMMDDYVMVKRV